MSGGFYWGANNPYLRPVWGRFRRAPKGLNPHIALIETAPGVIDANPAHIVFECMTNRDWGMGASVGAFDIPSFEVGAQKLFDERFGLSMMWTRSTSIEAFITEVIDHVHATLFLNPRTGLMTFMLLRDDFAIEGLRVINPSNAKLTNFQRKLWGETANELVVTYTDPANEGEATIAAQDIANIAMQGGIVSNGRNYYGIRTKGLAARVAERDLRASSQPLATCNVELDRRSWDILPGEVVILEWPEKGIERLVVRFGMINYGSVDQGSIKADVYEDIFSMSAASYLKPPDTEWVDPSTTPQPLSRVVVQTAPAFVAANGMSLTNASEIEFPEVVPMILASPDNTDALDYELIAEVTQSTGDVIWESFGSRDFVGGASLINPIVAETETFIPQFGQPTGASPLAGTLLLIGDVSEAEHELALVKEVTETGWTLSRGVLDTTPKAWAAGTGVWTIPTDRVFLDTTLRAVTEEVDYRLLTRTSGGLLEFEDAPSDTVILTARPHLPLRPANVRVNGVGFGAVAASGSTISVTWSNRNRLLETTQILPWDANTIPAEVDQTTTVYALSESGGVIQVFDGIVGTSFDLPVSEFSGHSTGRIRVTAKRGAFESLQGHEIVISAFISDTLGLSGESGALLLSGDAQSGTDKLRLGAE